MAGRFPEQEWVDALAAKLNTDAEYARVAREWEGDLLFIIEPDLELPEQIIMHLDLWHGTCRGAELLSSAEQVAPAFILQAPYGNFVRVLNGEWQPMQALLTRKLQLKGNMVYLMRNVPTVLEFVRCAQEVTSGVLGD